MRIRVAFFILSVVFMTSLVEAARLRSPKGRWEAEFGKVTPATTASPAKVLLTFFTPGVLTPSASADVVLPGTGADLQGRIQQLSKAIQWSPNEDFVILPGAAKPNPLDPTTVQRVLAVDDKARWPVKPFPFDVPSLRWVGPVNAFGPTIDGCRQTISEFDGREGTILPVIQPDLPAGFAITGSDARSLSIEKVAGPCAKDEDRRRISRECRRFDLSFKRLEIVECPK